MKAMIAELDSATAPTMVMGITMDNHGPWGEFPDHGMQLPQNLKEKARAEISDYISRAKDANDAFAYLIEALKRRARPTLVVLYGDHLPSLPAAYGEMKFADGKPPEQHSPPLRVWANYEIPPIPRAMPAYLLPGWILRAANQPLSGHFLANALLGQVLEDPSTSATEKVVLEQQYGHVAALSLNNANTSQAPKSVAITGAGLSDTLKNRLNGRIKPVKNSMQGFEIGLGLGWGSKPANLLATGMQTVTFRAYMSGADTECRAEARLGGYALDVKADGATVYRAAMKPGEVRLVTLDTHNVGNLKFASSAPNPSPKCKELAVRIPQVQCASLRCDADSAAGKTKNIYASRILKDDFWLQDQQARLKAFAWDSPAHNMTGMLRRMSAEQTGMSKFEVRDNVRLFMHPVAGRETWAEFDVSGLKQITLKPAIDPLVGECLTLNAPGEEAGVVGFAASLDSAPVLAHSIIDRNYEDVVSLDVGNAKRLRLTIDQGNKVDWCDWFAVGFPKVTQAE